MKSPWILGASAIGSPQLRTHLWAVFEILALGCVGPFSARLPQQLLVHYANPPLFRPPIRHADARRERFEGKRRRCCWYSFLPPFGARTPVFSSRVRGTGNRPSARGRKTNLSFALDVASTFPVAPFSVSLFGGVSPQTQYPPLARFHIRESGRGQSACPTSVEPSGEVKMAFHG